MEQTPDPHDRLAPLGFVGGPHPEGPVDLLSSDAPTSRRGMDLDLQVTERQYGRTRTSQPEVWHDATVHSMLTPTPLARAPRASGHPEIPLPPTPAAEPNPAPPPPARSRGASIPLPRLRDAIRSAADVERDRPGARRAWVLPVGIAAVTLALVLLASPIVVWFATRPAASEPTAEAPVAPEVLMGIPVRHDLNAPTE